MIRIREAKKSDGPFILEMIKQLAKFEKALDKVTLDLETLIQDGFAENPLFHSLIIEEADVPIGFALYYNRYSTWKGKSLYLEDLYIKPEHRGRGYGLAVMKYLAKLAVESECKRFEWQVLDWNEPAIKLYKTLSAEIDGEWLNCRVENQALTHLSE